MARPRRQTYTMKQYIDNLEEEYISNSVSIQRNPAWKPIVDGLVVTILTDDYIPPIILAEEENGNTVIVDGGSRTAAFRMICSGNYKIKSSVEDPIIKYKKKEKNLDGSVNWIDAEFDIRNKTFDKFPKELQKKFYEYQVETVIHECNSEKIAKYFRRYNVHTGMNTNEKMFIYLPKFADKVKKIVNKKFFLNYTVINDSQKEKGLLERIVAESVMSMFHFDKWNKNGKKISTYLNTNANEEEFDVLNNNISRLENIITADTKVLFNEKNTFIWITLFNIFTKLGLDDKKFAEFLNEFINGLRDKSVDGKLFDKVDDHGSTKDRSVIFDKLHILETLMLEFFDIEYTEEIDEEVFISNVVEIDKAEVHKNIDIYKEDLNGNDIFKGLKDNCIKDGSKLLEEKNNPSLLAMVAYSYKIGENLDEWLIDFASKNNTYIIDQQKNFLHMKNNFDKYCKTNKSDS